MSGADRTEAPTPKKRREARREGRIPRSAEVVSWSALLAGSYLATATVSSGVRLLRDLMHSTNEAVVAHDLPSALDHLSRALRGTLGVIAPLAVGMMVVGVVGHVVQVGWAPTTKGLMPKLSKLNPLAGLKRVASPAGLWEGGKAAIKAGLLAALSYGPVLDTTRELTAQGQLPVPVVVGTVAAATVALVRRVAVAGLLLAVLDYVLQRRRVNKGLRMTKQEVKDEARQSEGNPQLKGEIRSRAVKLSRNRMMAAVADADVVIVNPTHVAVALRYQASTGAPRVVAKGSGAVADRIRAEAVEHGVPLVGDIPLARTLHKACEVGEEIPVDLYEAVARILAFVFALRSRPRAIPAADGVHKLPTFAGA